ncbi:MAG: hypothetical protein JO261_08055 [Alphaproteobacteria bacterium]|nr:hypothetical protein [Alphaproteobacteria bacterium]MBV9693638.1 hypothetical protein [Alphaproteobacteria bacterium]
MMRTILSAAIFTVLLTPALAQHVPWQYGDMAGADLGDNADMHGAVPFPSDNAWNTDISTADVDPDSDNLIASIGLTTGLHPDFGSGTYNGAIIGIPYVVVSDDQPYVHIKLGAYRDESDKGPFPVPPNAPIEGYKPNGHKFGGDRHVLVIDRDTNRMYEMYRGFPIRNNAWKCDAGALFHLDSDDVRPTEQPGWTSADAAGLPIFPGLARYDEASTGTIPHALRFTVAHSREAYVPPANHWASNDQNPDLPPMGMRVRLKASFVIPSGFSKETKAILKALKTYGMMVADNGSNWYISGAPNDGWNNNKLVGELRQVQGSNFEVVKMVGIVTPQ